MQSANTPMSGTISLHHNLNDKSVDQTSYTGMTGSLLYLIASRRDIMFSVSLYVHF